jgi:hypothetical protein
MFIIFVIMRKSIIMVLLLLSVFAHSQKWEHTFGSPYRGENGVDVFETYDKGYLIMAGIEGVDSWLIKTDINGDMLWNKNFTDEMPYDVIFSTVLSDSSGNIYLMGWRVVQFQDGWPLIVKLDSCGEQVWCRQFIDDDYDWGWFQEALILDNGDILGMTHMESQEQIDMVFLYRITPDGELLWKKSYASKNNYPLIHSRTPLRLQYINDVFTISGYCYYAYPNNPPHGYLRPLFIGVDALFEEQFVLPFGMADSIPGKAFSSIAINDTLIMGVGQHWLLTDKNIYDNSLLMFYDITGNEHYFKDIPNQSIGANIQGNWIRHIEYIDDSLLFATSYFGENYEGNDGGEFVIDTSGHVYRHASHPNTVANSSLLKTHDGKFVIVTSQKTGNYWDVLLYKVNDTLGTDTLYTGSYVYDSLCPYQIPSDTINLAGCLVTTNITNTLPPEPRTPQLHIFPNPAGDEINCQLSIVNSKLSMFIYDLYGRKQVEIIIPPGQEQIRIDISAYPAGVYMAVLNDETGVVARGKFVKH